MLARLTPREVEVLRRVAEGHSGQEIAQILCISPKTVQNIRQSIMCYRGSRITRTTIICIWAAS